MRNIIRSLCGAFLCGLAAFGYQVPAIAQTAIVGRVVTTCGTPLATYTAGRPGALTLDTTGTLCTAGGGGGAGAVYGPTAVGSAAANPPVLVGGTIDGTATGNVSVLKVVSGVGYINCANCSGGGISVTYGSAIGTVGTPNGYKDSSGNFQPILGDTTNGQWVSIKAGSIANTSFGATLGSSAVSAGAFVSGSVLSGALASGAVVDINNGTNTAYAGSGQATVLGALYGIYNAATGPIPAGSATIGSIANTSFIATQATAANLNATVVGTGVFATQSAITAASGALASGSVASGAFASGSFAAVAATKAASTPAAATDIALVVDQRPGTNVTVGPYPAGAVAITASATGTTGATTATLAGTSGKTTYICGYSIRANATAATTVTNTITGVITATLSSIMWVSAAATGLGVDEQIFSPCIPASATNTSIAIISGAPGTGGNVSSKGWGYQL